jgi:type IV pilus assembly protein PilP
MPKKPINSLIFGVSGFSCRATLRLAAILLVCHLGAPGLLVAEEQTEPLAAESSSAGLTAGDGFVYKREGRNDPFVPFLTNRAKIATPDPGVIEEELVGMRKFEPGQLTLVAIILAGKEGMAMVQDPAGQGYVIRKGTKIGRTGVVEDIIPNRVIVQNVTYTRAGDKRFNRVDMLLKKEGEEK